MLPGHVTLEAGTAPPDSTYKAVLRVGHGCEGKPTTSIRVKIPAAGKSEDDDGEPVPGLTIVDKPAG